MHMLMPVHIIRQAPKQTLEGVELSSDCMTDPGRGDLSRIARHNQLAQRRFDIPVTEVIYLFGQIQMQDRKSTRLNSSHVRISYAVFCLKKKKHRPPISI